LTAQGITLKRIGIDTGCYPWLLAEQFKLNGGTVVSFSVKVLKG
jgi:hypothetical protein